MGFSETCWGSAPLAVSCSRPSEAFFQPGSALGSPHLEQVRSLGTAPSPVPAALGAFRYGRQKSKQLNNSAEP